MTLLMTHYLDKYQQNQNYVHFRGLGFNSSFLYWTQFHSSSTPKCLQTFQRSRAKFYKFTVNRNVINHHNLKLIIISIITNHNFTYNWTWFPLKIIGIFNFECTCILMMTIIIYNHMFLFDLYLLFSYYLFTLQSSIYHLIHII